ncbi:mis18-binding protein 1 [Polymixia lowei]
MGNSKHFQGPPLSSRDLDAIKMTNRTPVKGLPPHLLPQDDGCGRSVLGEQAAENTVPHPLKAHVLMENCPPMTPAKMFAHMKEKERKRKREQQESHTVGSSSTGVLRNGGIHISVEKLPMMSPAKMFAHLKAREQKKKEQELDKVRSCTMELRNGGHSCPSQDKPAFTTFDQVEMDDTFMDAFRRIPESAFPVTRSSLGPAVSPSECGPSDDVPLPAVKPQPVLLEDPLVLNSPHIIFPKKREAMFTRSTVCAAAQSSESTHRQAPKVNKIYLKQWYLRFNHLGFYVDGTRRDDNMPWHSNIIVERYSKSELKTVSGKTYILLGKMNIEHDLDLPKWLLKKFVYGFPPNWKMYFDKFRSESRNMEAESSSKGTKNCPASEKSTINLSVKRHRPEPSKTLASCPPASSSSVLFSNMTMSRSGRTIKPPLEYWKGGRVILDADMNVTIHECYETSICTPQANIPTARRMPQRPDRVYLPCSEAQRHSELTGNNESSGPLRKVKAPLHIRNRAKAQPDKTSSNQVEVPEETQNGHNNSPEEQTARARRSGLMCPATEKALNTDSVLQPPVKPNQRSKQRSKKRNCEDPSTSSESVLPRKQRKKSGKGVYSRGRGRKVLNDSQSSNLSPSSQSSNSSEANEKVPRKRAVKPDVTKGNKCNKTPQSPKPAPKLTQSSKTRNGSKSASANKPIPQEEDEDEWTEAELAKLQKAVTLYPKHVGSYWIHVAMKVGTRSAEECQKRHTSQGTFQAPSKKAKMSQKKEEPTKEAEPPKINARVGTLKRKQEVRQFMEAMPKEDHDDYFSSTSAQSKCFQLPSMSPSGKEHGLMFSDQGPMTPGVAGFPTVKTPQCLHITPGMIGSVNRKCDDKYIYRLQQRMKKNQVNVYTQHSPTSKKYTTTPSVKRTMRRCNTENDSFVVWEMFPDNDGAFVESGEEEDFYFSDND